MWRAPPIVHTLKVMNKKSLLAIAFSASTALALTACGNDADPQPATATAEATDTAAESAISSASETAEASAESEAADTTEAQPTETLAAADGEDPVFAAIDAVNQEFGDAVIVEIDREDDTATYDIDAVIGEELVEFRVDADTGGVVEEEREQDDDKVAKVANLNVSVDEAIQQALDQHPGALVDDVELDEENDVLEWQIDLDDAERNDLAEVRVVAS